MLTFSTLLNKYTSAVLQRQKEWGLKTTHLGAYFIVWESHMRRHSTPIYYPLDTTGTGLTAYDILRTYENILS